METAQSLANRFREVTLNGTWIANTNYATILDQVDVEIANKKIADLNTISMLTQHVLYYINGLNQVFEGGTLDIRDKFSFNFDPPISDDAWNVIKSNFTAASTRFAEHVDNFQDEQLKAGFVKEEYGSYRRNIEGMIEHAYYHLGQISLILKLAQKS